MSKGNVAISARAQSTEPTAKERKASAVSDAADYDVYVVTGAFTDYGNLVEVVSVAPGEVLVRLTQADEDYMCLDRVNGVAVTFEVAGTDDTPGV